MGGAAPAAALTPLDVLFAAESLLPPIGGAERLTLEVLEALAQRHAIRAIWLGEGHSPTWLEGAPIEPPADEGGYWQTKRLRREAVGHAVERALAERPASVVVTQLHAAPAVVAAAEAASTPSVLVLPSYESLCKYAFDFGSTCVRESRCRACPAALALSHDERDELERSRTAHERSLRGADRLIAVSRAVAGACAGWSGRTPEVVSGTARMPTPVRADRDGPVVAVATRWNLNKGVDLLEPIARGVRPRRLRVTESGLPAELRTALERLGNVEAVAEAPFAELLEGASLLLVPSQWPEPFGRTALEGMAGGVPTLASATGGLLDFVPEEQLVARFEDPDAWLEAIAELDDDPRWEAAVERGLSAGQAVLASDPAGRFEETLLAAVH